MAEGFESYAIDFRPASATHHLSDGDTVVLPTRRAEVPIAGALDIAAVQAAIREAQQSLF